MSSTKGPDAGGDLFRVMYGELRRVAGRYLGRERANHTLQPTALVNEAWLRLQNQHGAQWQGMAAAEFDSIVAHPGAVPGAIVYPLAWLGHPFTSLRDLGSQPPQEVLLLGERPKSCVATSLSEHRSSFPLVTRVST